MSLVCLVVGSETVFIKIKWENNVWCWTMSYFCLFVYLVTLHTLQTAFPKGIMCQFIRRTKIQLKLLQKDVLAPFLIWCYFSSFLLHLLCPSQEIKPSCRNCHFLDIDFIMDRHYDWFYKSSFLKKNCHYHLMFKLKK